MSVDAAMSGFRGGRSMSMTGRSMTFVPTASISSPGQPASNRVVINVGGVRYETFKSTLKNIPDTRLSWITESTSHNIDFDPGTREYFFDRHPGVFLMILNYYRTGKLHAPTDVCGPLFEDELSFWGIDEKQIEPCCWMNYRQHRDAQDTLQELEDDDQTRLAEDSDDDYEFTSKAAKIFGIEEDEKKNQSCWQRTRPKVWSLLDDPYASTASKVFTTISMFFVLVSIVGFVMESHKLFRIDKDPNNTYAMTQNQTVTKLHEMTTPYPVFDVIEIVCLVYFTIELTAKFIFCPSRLEFIKAAMTWVDIISILPFFIETILFGVHPDLDGTEVGLNVRLILQGFKLFRIFRIFKVVKYINGVKILYHAVKASAQELLLLILLLCVGVLIFAVLIYFAELVEESPNNSFTSIPIGFWWAVVTMTTLGYGDTNPRTGVGYVIGSVCAVCGVLLIALPVPVIVNNFQLYYSHAQAKAKLPKKRKHILVGAADALKNPFPVDDEADERSRSPSISPSIGSTASSDRKGSEDTIGSIDSGIKTGGSSTSTESTGISVIFTDEVAEPSRMSSPVDRLRTPPTAGLRISRPPARRISLFPVNSETNKVHPAHQNPSRKSNTLALTGGINYPPRRRSLMPSSVAE